MISDTIQLFILLRNQVLSADRLKALQESKLRHLVAHAYQNVEFYRSWFRKAGASPKDIRTIDDLNGLPVVTKEELRAAGIENCIAKTADLNKCVRIKTSGSTGEKFIYYFSREETLICQLIEFRSLLNIGFRPYNRLAVLGPETPHKRRLHQHFRLFRSENISALLSHSEQIRRLREIRPTIIWAYPTVLETLLHALDYSLSKVLRPRTLITSAEVFPSHLRRKIAADLDVDIYNFYGAREIGRIAYECPCHQGLHVNADHVILQTRQIGNEDGNELWTEAILTSLNAHTMPLIRYRIGDLCQTADKTCICGSSFPLIGAPIGRTNDIFALPSGRLISPISLGFLIRRFDHYKQFQLVQLTNDSFLLEIAADNPVKENEVVALRNQIMTYLSEPVQLSIRLVSGFRPEGPKFRPFISRVGSIKRL